MNDDLVQRLRRWTHAADAVPAGDIMDEAADCIERLRLTDAEREALVELCCTGEQSPFPRDWRAAATLRKFLGRVT